MSISITLTPAEERKLGELARARGKDPAGYAHDVVSAYLKVAEETGSRSFAEILSPIWEEWRRSGLTDAEVDNLFEQELQGTRSERRSAKGTP